FDYALPEELIALTPVAQRDRSRLLQVGGSKVAHHIFKDVPELLSPGDLLVVNNTKVFPAALTAIRPARQMGGGGYVTIDINLLHPITEEKGEVTWRAFARPAKRLKEGDSLSFQQGLRGEVLRREEGVIDLCFPMQANDFMATLEKIGHMPLPPYIARKRPPAEDDKERYQTVYAKENGSVAAPTAGLHFTKDVFKALEAKGIGLTHVTLHVGAGTFLPVTAEKIEDHKMHSEWGEVTDEVADRINRVKRKGGRIVAVGTTSTRLLETAANPEGQLATFRGETDIFITPGFSFRIVDALITNFHLPKSTLMMLISAFAGTETIRNAYKIAVEEKYRFFSYGDACLLESIDSKSL
ncbi:MAG: tRNA preQ1(34) S-adenosylmethionine ribosyltransferase-isomerase QueA, partial [Pseudomonadota bacterium]